MITIHEFMLGGVKWTIKIDDKRLQDLGLLGLCEISKSLISLFEKDVNESIVDQTLYHELVHAILETMGETELSANDKFVQNFGMLLHQFIVTKR